MAEGTITAEGREIVESVRNKAKQENITIPQAARKLDIPVHRYYKFLGQMNRSRGRSVSRTRHRRVKGAEVLDHPNGTGRGGKIRELRDQNESLTKENGQLREELLDVLIENRHLRATLERNRS